MLRLYYAPETCALASHLALECAGARYDVELVDLTAGEQTSQRYRFINPKARVPALMTTHGVLTETPAILAYVAHRFPEAQLMPEDPWDFAQAQAFNSYLCSTLHVAHAHRMRGARGAMTSKPLRRCRERFQDPWAMHSRSWRHPCSEASGSWASKERPVISICLRCRDGWRLTASTRRITPEFGPFAIGCTTIPWFVVYSPREAPIR